MAKLLAPAARKDSEPGHAHGELGRGHDYTVDLILQHAHHHGIGVEIRPRHEGEDLASLLLQPFAEGMQHAHIEGIFEIADDQGDDIGPLGGEAAGNGIRHVVELARGFEDFLLRLLRDVGTAAEGARDGGLRDAGKSRDIEGGDPRPQHRRLLVVIARHYGTPNTARRLP
jgi:hypothetical protein